MGDNIIFFIWQQLQTMQHILSLKAVSWLWDGVFVDYQYVNIFNLLTQALDINLMTKNGMLPIRYVIAVCPNKLTSF